MISGFDGDSVVRIVNEYSDMIMRIAFQHTRNKTDAEDILQEVFLALVKPPLFSGEEHLKAWLIRVTINKCKNLLKRQKRDIIPQADSVCFGLDEANLDVLDGVKKLSAVDRNIVHLFYFEGYSAKETAEILDMKEDAVFTRLKRARKKLKNILEEKE